MLLFGHRGSAATAPENTLASFKAAFAVPCDGIELDIRLSADERIIVMHDPSLKRTTGIDALVSAMCSSQLSTINANALWETTHHTNVTIPTLDEVLACCPKRCSINIEIKTDAPHSLEQLAAKLVQLISQYPELTLFVSSFDAYALACVHQQDADIPLAMAFDSPPAFDTAITQRYWAYSLHYSLVTPEIMTQANQHQLAITVWTVNTVEEAERLQALGVHSIISDNPAKLKAALKLP